MKNVILGQKNVNTIQLGKRVMRVFALLTMGTITKDVWEMAAVCMCYLIERIVDVIFMGIIIDQLYHQM